MNKKQFDMIANKLIRFPWNREAAKLVIMHGYTAYEAEKVIHGRATNTAMRDAKRILREYNFAVNLINLGE